MSVSSVVRAVGEVLRVLLAPNAKPIPAPLLTYRKAYGGWYCFYRGASGFGLTKRDAAKAAIKASVAP